MDVYEDHLEEKAREFRQIKRKTWALEASDGRVEDELQMNSIRQTIHGAF
jgi:hypothetical protein